MSAESKPGCLPGYLRFLAVRDRVPTPHFRWRLVKGQYERYVDGLNEPVIIHVGFNNVHFEILDGADQDTQTSAQERLDEVQPILQAFLDPKSGKNN